MAVTRSPLEGHILVPTDEYARLRATEAKQRVHTITRGVTRFVWIAVGAVLAVCALAVWQTASPDEIQATSTSARSA